MLDENLPTFFFGATTTKAKNERSVFLSQNGSDAEVVYKLLHPNSSSAAAKNCYAVALVDAFSSEVVYGEVLVRPQWANQSASGESSNAAPVQPALPTEYTLQLYNPDQQVRIYQRLSGWSGSASYEFSLPQHSFRLPSGSSLDKDMDDPSAESTTVRNNFCWKRDGKLSKDVICFYTGRSTDIVKKKRKKEPDIAVALFRSLKELTIYEPNLSRIDMEDPKGLELVLLLGATLMKDVLSVPLREAFNITESAHHRTPVEPPPRLPSRPASTSRLEVSKGSGSSGKHLGSTAISTSLLPPMPSHDRRSHTPHFIPQTQPNSTQRKDDKSKKNDKMEDAELRRLRKMEREEDKERRKKEAEIEKETERLRRKYGNQEQRSSSTQPKHTGRPAPPASYPLAAQGQLQGRQPVNHPGYNLQQRPWPQQRFLSAPQGPYMQQPHLVASMSRLPNINNNRNHSIPGPAWEQLRNKYFGTP